MSDNGEDDEVDRQSYLKLVHLYTAIKQSFNIKVIERILQDPGNINYQFPPDPCLKSLQPKLVGSTILHFAINFKELNLNILELLLNYGADCTVKNDTGSTALHQTIERESHPWFWKRHLENTYIAKMLSWQVCSQNPANPCSSDGMSHFHMACMTNHEEAVSFFLENGTPVDQAICMSARYFPGYTSLHFAVRFCAVETIEILLCFRAKLDIQDARGINPMHVAIKQMMDISDSINKVVSDRDRTDLRVYKEIMKQLLKGSDYTDSTGLTYFQIICMIGDTSLAEKALEQIDDIDHFIKFDSPVWPGYTALHFAVSLFNVEIVQLLLKNDANIIVKDANGISPFDMCLKSYNLDNIRSVLSNASVLKDILFSDGKTSLVDVVMDIDTADSVGELKNMNIFLPFNSPVWPGYTPLHIAIVLKDENEVESCYSRYSGSSEYSDEYDDEMVFERLIIDKYFAEKVDLSAQYSNGSTLLHLAFQLKKGRVIKRLIEVNRSDITNAVDNNGLSHLHIAAAVDDGKLVAELLKSGVAVDARVWTTLEGLEFDSVIPKYSTALHIAVAGNCRNAMRVLVENGANAYIKDANGMTPIHRQIEAQIYFLDDEKTMLNLPKLKNCIVDSCNLSHLHVACLLDAEKAVKRLLNQGADVNAAVKSVDQSNKSLQFLAPYAGFTPLHFALKTGRRNICELLIERGADLFAQSSKGIVLLYEGLESISSTIFDTFFSTLTKNEDLRRRMYEQTGLTMLHIACDGLDHRQWGNFELCNRRDVNARSHEDSPFCPGSTPLDILIKRYENYDENSEMHWDIDTLIELGFLENGADVTLVNGSNTTALLEADRLDRAWRLKFNNRGARITRSRRLSILLHAHKDFNINPANNKGISHFHVACLKNYNYVAKKFIEHNVNVNSAISSFSDEFPGCTPLHLTMIGDVDPKLTQLLLNHGADVHARDVYGNTALHFAAKYSNCNCELFQMIIDKGVDVNAKNSSGDTPLDVILDSCPTRSETLLVETIELFLKKGYRVNSYHPANNKGWIPKALSRCTGRNTASEHKSIRAIISCATDVLEIDDLGRSSIHNLSSYSYSLSDSCKSSENVKLLRDLLNRGCDMDHQDSLGRSALHIAVKLKNYKVVIGLSKLGADINLEDVNRKTAFAYCSEENYANFADGKKIINMFVKHIRKLQLIGLDVHKDNLMTLEKFDREIVVDCSRIRDQLKRSKNINIRYREFSFILYDLLSETTIVAAYPNMLQSKRQAISGFFKSDRIYKLCRIKLDELDGFLMLQYKKAVKRGSLISKANECLNLLAGSTVPSCISEMITNHLSNMDLKNFNASVGETLLNARRRL